MAYEVIIIGAGVTGLFTAKYLVDRGVDKILILEEKYPGAGGSFRCATGIRASFTSREHIKVMLRSIELWPKLSSELGIKYSRDGYLWLLSREKDVEAFEKIVRFQNELGVPTKVITPEEVRELAPTINIENIKAGVYDPLAGKASCFDAVVNTLVYLKKRGVRVEKGVRALRIAYGNGTYRVYTTKGVFESEKLLISAGEGSRDLARTIGVELPIRNLPKHALVTEAFRQVLKPLVIDWASSSYIVQLFNGNFYIGADIPEEYDREARCRQEFLRKAAKVWTSYFPWLREVHVLRYWTGYYDMTPDHHPIVGPVEGFDGLYIAAGFSGHGFMMSPAVGEALASYITTGRPTLPEFENLSPGRFRRGELIKEIAVFG
ncbi:NAD(P)/FAD-dependent oxidoreductase [Thermogladius sp. 4427co]|uniref:NAD(P)/FAD-dependent oxidoreductase n=1 Tax=Thermogladius sp. 4427co TaxID=3450718 RepID=UPI003F7A423A